MGCVIILNIKNNTKSKPPSTFHPPRSNMPNIHKITISILTAFLLGAVLIYTVNAFVNPSYTPPNGQGAFTYTSGGNVGLRNTNPQVTLDVNGSIRSTGSAANVQVWDLSTGAPNSGVLTNLFRIKSGPDQGSFRIQLNTDSAGFFSTVQELAIIKDNGNVGIGSYTSSPSESVPYKLDVKGDINTSGSYRVAGTGGVGVTCAAGTSPNGITISGGIVTSAGICTTIGGAGATPPGGTNGAVQFNASGAFGGDSTNFSWDNTNKRLNIGSAVQDSLFVLSRGIPTTFKVGTDGAMVIDNDGVSNVFALSAGNVGIGTSGPGEKLDVVGSIQTQGSAVGSNRLVMKDTSASPRTWEWYPQQGGANTLGLFERVSGITALTILAPSGNVGIGTAAPGAKLEVNGSVRIPLLNCNNASVLETDASGNLQCGADAGAAGSGLTDAFTRVENSAGVSQFAAVGADKLQFAVGAGLSVAFDNTNKRVTFTNTGGPGGSLPAGTLAGQTLRWDGSVWAANSNLFNNGTNIGAGGSVVDTSYQLTIPSASTLGGIKAETSDATRIGGYFANTAAGGVGLVVGAGNVGIGTGNPGKKLTVLDSSGDGGKIRIQYSYRYTTHGEIGMVQGPLNSDIWIGQNLNSGGSSPSQSNTGQVSWYTKMGGFSDNFSIARIPAGGSASALLTILNSGNVGIGNAGSGYKLDVTGNINGSTGVYDTGVRVCSTSNPSGCPAGVVSGWTDGGANVYLTTITDNVGIGTTGTSNKLAVTGTSGQYAAFIYNPAAAGSSYGVYIQAGGNSSDTALAVDNATGVSNFLYVKGSGNVGIGTAAPGTKLDTTGTIRSTGLGSAFSGVGAEMAYSSNVGYFITYDRGASAVKATHLGGDGGTGLRVDTAGNVGIGTPGPAYKLDVAGQIRSSSGGFVFPDGTIQSTASYNTRVFNRSGTFTVPTGVTKITVDVWGGGGGGGGGIEGACIGYGGSGGGFGRQSFTVTPGAIYTVTVGDGGYGTLSSSGQAGGSGQTSSFGALISATGGGGGSSNCGVTGAGGTSAATINFPGGLGLNSGAGGYAGGADGYGGGLGGTAQGSTQEIGAEAPGGGGIGSGAVIEHGSEGAHGRVIVYW